MNIIFSICNRIKENRYYAWYITRYLRYLSNRKSLLQGYTYSPRKKNESKKKVICIFDGKIHHGGLADRLRGIISTYQVCKELNLDFGLYFIHPFSLTDYLLPNQFDWVVTKKDLDFNLQNTCVCYLDTITCSSYEKQKQRKWLSNKLESKYSQYHVYTNAAFSYNDNYSEYFNELFKLSPRLENSLKQQIEVLGKDYLSVSCRFLNLLGDFNETYNVDILSEIEKEKLIQLNLQQLIKLHDLAPNSRILVNSDSRTFLRRAQDLAYVYVIPGNIVHIDNAINSDYESFEKTFVDFFMIAKAKAIYLFTASHMHNSGYPYAASLIYKSHFQIIKF